MKSKYRHWSDPAKTGSTEKNFFFFHISHFNVLISKKQPIYLSHLFHVYKILTFEFFFPSYTQNQNPSNIIQKTKIITIPLAICQASENSCLVEKFSSTSQGSSPDSSRFSIESGIAEAWFFASDADGLVRSSLSVTLNSSS